MINSPVITATANRFSEFVPSLWHGFDKLGSVLLSFWRWNTRWGSHFHAGNCGGVVRYRDPVAKIKIAKFFSKCVRWWFAKIYARENFPLLSSPDRASPHQGIQTSRHNSTKNNPDSTLQAVSLLLHRLAMRLGITYTNKTWVWWGIVMMTSIVSSVALPW